MFSRIRYAAKVLTYSAPKVNPADQPDIVFEEESRPEISKISRAIGSFIEIVLVSLVIGIVSGPFVLRLFSHEKTSVIPIVGFLASLLAFGAHRIIDDLNTRLRLQLKIGERISPYFGHRILRAMHTLRG